MPKIDLIVDGSRAKQGSKEVRDELDKLKANVKATTSDLEKLQATLNRSASQKVFDTSNANQEIQKYSQSPLIICVQ